VFFAFVGAEDGVKVADTLGAQFPFDD